MVTRNGAKRIESFFSVLLEDFETGLIIPASAAKSFGSKESVILTTKNGSCTVSINKTGNGRLRFQGNGWADFIRNNSLSEGDFLVFTFVGASLTVSAFGKNCCLKLPNSESTTTSTIPIPLEPSDDFPAPQFVVTFTRFNLFGLIVSEDFVTETRMRNRKRVVVKDWEGREWLVKVTQLSNGEILLSDGWVDFVRENRLEIGMTCAFRSLLNNVDDDVLVILHE